eukprot:1012827-Pleurochrysis_carterae.AAC.1
MTVPRHAAGLGTRCRSCSLLLPARESAHSVAYCPCAAPFRVRCAWQRGYVARLLCEVGDAAREEEEAVDAAEAPRARAPQQLAQRPSLRARSAARCVRGEEDRSRASGKAKDDRKIYV